MLFRSNLAVLKELKKIGSGADVVSAGELLKAIKAGISAKKIVFSGVGKTREEIELAIKKRVLLINMESESEAKLINTISKKMSRTTSVGLRLNPNVTGKTNKKISTGGRHDKFGLSYNDSINLRRQNMEERRVVNEHNYRWSPTTSNTETSCKYSISNNLLNTHSKYSF